MVATTRFPVDCARRFDLEPDAREWRDRLTVVAMDLRDLVTDYHPYKDLEPIGGWSLEMRPTASHPEHPDYAPKEVAVAR